MPTKTTRKPPARARARRLRPTRQYSRAFTPRPPDGDRSAHPTRWGTEYKMSRIPLRFWRSVQAKAKREGVSLRHKLLTYLQDWLDDKAA